jgi:hypothetical protein
MAYVECWLSYGGPHCVLFPREVADFDGYMIAKFLVREITNGVRMGRVQSGSEVTVKGNMISLNPAFRYLLRLRRVQGSEREEYQILPDGGFRQAQRLPLNWNSLGWILKNELQRPSPEADFWNILAAVGAQSLSEVREVTELMLTKQPWYQDMRNKSDYYRMEAICRAKEAWPASLGPIRKLQQNQLRCLADDLTQRPHDLCYYAHSRHYGLGEMSFASLEKLTLPALTSKVCMGAARFYEMLKQERIDNGHTIFVMTAWLGNFKLRHPQYPAEGSLHWLFRQGHLLPMDYHAEYVDRERVFDEPSPVHYVQFPRDDLLKERILGHLRRIHQNFLAASGKYTARDPEGCVITAPRGPLNEMQREALRHVLNNPITIIQGGPGSGKTAFGVEHLSCLFQEIAVYTHVGRQAVAICDRLGGNRENASTIHSAYHKRQKKTHEALLRTKYSERVEIVVVDEVFNCDEYTMEMVLALNCNASRVVFIGDPDQIMPIPGEEGAGTPALDIAKAFPAHVITLNENMRQQESARAIHDVVTNVRIKQSRAILWAPPNRAVLRVDPPPRETTEALTQVLGPIIKRLRQGINRDEHAWQIVTFYNGYKPEQQGVGVRQLNEIIEKWMDVHEPGRKKGGCAINKKLFLHPGSKILIGAAFKPDKSLKPAGLNKRKPSAQAAIRKKLAAGNGDTVYSETRNGQIEVVKSIRSIKVKGSAADSWVVECEPKGQCVKGAKLLINRRLHVDPSAIEPAWAITSNKSMGGECKNVCVYIPTTIGHSRFDRSSLYVALSRPIEWLGVVGRLQDIHTMVMRDPRPVLTGLSTRLATASVTPPGVEPVGWDWKVQHDYELHGMINEELLAGFEDIYDQSQRRVFGKPTSLCSLSWASFLASEELLLKGNAPAIKRLAVEVKAIQERLYANVENHMPRIDAPWERPGDIPLLPAVHVEIAPFDAELLSALEPLVQADDRGNDDDDGDDQAVESHASVHEGLIIVPPTYAGSSSESDGENDDLAPVVYVRDPLTRKARPEESESL